MLITFRGNISGVEFSVELMRKPKKTTQTHQANIDTECVRKGQVFILYLVHNWIYIVKKCKYNTDMDILER